MITSICWGFCTMAGEASGDKHFPAPMRSFFGFWCSFWYAIAMIAQGDAGLFWKEYLENRRARIANRTRAADVSCNPVMT